MGLKEDTDRLKEFYKGCIMPWGIDLSRLSDVEKLYSDITFEYLGEQDLCKYDDVYKEVSKTLDDNRFDLLNHKASTLLNYQEVRKVLQLWRYWGFDDWVGYVPRYGSKEDYYKKIITLYDILQPHESNIVSMNNNINAVYELRSNPSNESYCSHSCQMLRLLNRVCKFYHDDIECIRCDILEVQPDKDENKVLPKELDTDEARRWLSKTIEKGFMIDGYQWAKETTRYQIAMWVEIAGEKLGIQNKWKWAHDIWKLKDLAQTRHESKDRFGKVEREKDIEACFE